MRDGDESMQAALKDVKARPNLLVPAETGSGRASIVGLWFLCWSSPASVNIGRVDRHVK